MTDTSHWVTTSKHFGPDAADGGFTRVVHRPSGAGKSTIAELVAAQFEAPRRAMGAPRR